MQVSHRVHTDADDQRKASTLPRRHERSRTSDGPKSAKTETETTSKADGKHRKEKLQGKSSVGDLQLLETVAKITTAFETETTPRDVTYDVTYDVTRGKRELPSKHDDVCDPVRGSTGPVFRRGRRSRPSVVAGRRSSTVAVARRGKAAAARKAPSSSRVPPVGAAATPVKVDGPACWVTCLDDKDSDEDSYVTACNSTPLLSRAFPFSRKDDALQLPDNNRKSYQTGNSSGRRRRRRFKSPSAYDFVGGEETPTVDLPAPQAPHMETTIMCVPIPVIVVLLLLYVLGGTVMFRLLYGVGDWSEAAYISLTAMLTVGGWYPDRRTDDTGAGRWVWTWPPDARFVYAVWVVVGLAMVSACLRLTLQTLSYSTCRRSQSRCQP